MAQRWWISALLVLGFARVAHAELYVYEDAQGVVHFTNVEPGATKKVAKTRNTYTMQAEQRDVLRIHRVDVADFDAIIAEAAKHYSLPVALVKAVVAAESAFEPRAVSKAGALGLMQLVPATALDMHVRDAFDPRDNIFGGARYLRVLANQFKGDMRLTLAAYNAGPDAVAKHGGVPPFGETREYLNRVLTYYEHYQTRDAHAAR